MKNKELTINGKPIWDWAKDNNWIQIGSWQYDPKELSLKLINDTIDWEIRTAKREVMQEFRDLINTSKLSENMEVVINDKNVYLDARWILSAIDSILEEYKEFENKLPEEKEYTKEEKQFIKEVFGEKRK